MKELVCIVCPRGCRLRVDEQTGAVTGNGCPRGASYGLAEVTNPTRVVTSTVAVRGGIYPRCPVKTNAPIPKANVLKAVRELDGLLLDAPIKSGQIIIKNVCGSGINFVATRDLPQKQ